MTADSGEACARVSASCSANRMLSVKAVWSFSRPRLQAWQGACPNPRNLRLSFSRAQITTRVLVLPRTTPTASFDLLAMPVVSRGRDDSIHAYVEPGSVRPFRFDVAV